MPTDEVRVDVNRHRVDALSGLGNMPAPLLQITSLSGVSRTRYVGRFCCLYTIQQNQNMRYLDAYDSPHDGHDYRAVTRPSQDDDTQKWLIQLTEGGPYTNQKKFSKFSSSFTNFGEFENS